MKKPIDIAFDIVGCYCDEAYKSRGLNDPNCPIHSFSVEEAIGEAQQDAIQSCIEVATKNLPDSVGGFNIRNTVEENLKGLLK